MTYAELTTLLEGYIQNSALTSMIPQFVELAQSRISRDLISPELESLVEIAVTGGDKYADLPVDVMEILSLQVPESGGSYAMIQTSLADIAERNRGSASGSPNHYGRYGLKLILSPVPEQDVTLDCVYRGRLPELVEDTDTDFLLTYNPNIYIYASMLEVVPFLREDSAEKSYQNRWNAYYKEEVAALNAKAETLSWSGGPIQITQQGMDTP